MLSVAVIVQFPYGYRATPQPYGVTSVANPESNATSRNAPRPEPLRYCRPNQLRDPEQGNERRSEDRSDVEIDPERGQGNGQVDGEAVRLTAACCRRSAVSPPV